MSKKQEIKVKKETKKQNSSISKAKSSSAIPEMKSVSVPIVPVVKKYGYSFQFNDETTTIIGTFKPDNMFFESFEIIGDSFKNVNDNIKYDTILKEIGKPESETDDISMLKSFSVSLSPKHYLNYEIGKYSGKMEIVHKFYQFISKKFHSSKTKKSFELYALSIVKGIGNALLKQDISGIADSLSLFSGIISSGDFSVSAKNENHVISAYCKAINEFFESGKIEIGNRNWFIKGVSYKLKPASSTEISSKFIAFQDIKSFRNEISKRFECQLNQFENYIDYTEIKIKIGKNETETIKIK